LEVAHENGQDEEAEIEDGLCRQIALEAALPDGRHAYVVKMGDIFASPVHPKVWVQGGYQGHQGVDLDGDGERVP